MYPNNFEVWVFKIVVLEWEQRSVRRPVCHRSPQRVILPPGEQMPSLATTSVLSRLASSSELATASVYPPSE